MLYGTWAYLVNMSHGTASALMAACVQGSYSFVLTFFMTMLVETCYRLVQSLTESRQLVMSLTVLISCSVVFSLSWWVNAMAGTPEIFRTVILGYVVGGAYTIVYVLSLASDKSVDEV